MAAERRRTNKAKLKKAGTLSLQPSDQTGRLLKQSLFCEKTIRIRKDKMRKGARPS